VNYTFENLGFRIDLHTSFSFHLNINVSPNIFILNTTKMYTSSDSMSSKVAGDYLLGFHYGSPGLIPGQVMWNLWWIMLRVFCNYFSVPCQFSFHHPRPFINHPITDAIQSRYWNCCLNNQIKKSLLNSTEIITEYYNRMFLLLIPRNCVSNFRWMHLSETVAVSTTNKWSVGEINNPQSVWVTLCSITTLQYVSIWK
jgi:hypothetical protein